MRRIRKYEFAIGKNPSLVELPALDGYFENTPNGLSTRRYSLFRTRN